MLQRAESLSARSLARAWCDTVDVEVSGLVVTQHLRGEQLYSRCVRMDTARVLVQCGARAEDLGAVRVVAVPTLSLVPSAFKPVWRRD